MKSEGILQKEAKTSQRKLQNQKNLINRKTRPLTSHYIIGKLLFSKFQEPENSRTWKCKVKEYNCHGRIADDGCRWAVARITTSALWARLWRATKSTVTWPVHQPPSVQDTEHLPDLEAEKLAAALLTHVCSTVKLFIPPRIQHREVSIKLNF